MLRDPVLSLLKALFVPCLVVLALWAALSHIHPLLVSAGIGLPVLALALAVSLPRAHRKTMHAIQARERHLEQMADLDPLTSVFNRRLLQTRLEAAVAAARRRAKAVSLLLIDADQFRRINADAGPGAGDAVLASLGRTLRGAVRASDVVGRWDGDEFGVVAADTAAEEALALAQRLQEDLRARLRVPGGTELSFSIGVADLPACADDANSLLRAAESALALAQRRGPGRVLYFRSLDLAEHGPDEVSILTERLKNVTLGTIRALATAVDKRDHYTHGHGRALSQLLITTADRLGLDPHATSVLMAGAELHDVGKIGVPDQILGKPGPLTAEEYAIIQRHPETGKDIVAAARELDDLVPAILYHHERWDGTGYPRGLIGTQIPLVARLIAIADAYHAMVSDRPYRRALTQAEALAELRRNAGTQFDPDLTSVFIAVVETQLELTDQELETAA